jgi:hypothetical protein
MRPRRATPTPNPRPRGVRVTSPVGEYDYTVNGVRFDRGRIVVAGNLGVWETTMVVEPSDWLMLARKAARPTAAVGVAALVAAALRRR